MKTIVSQLLISLFFSICQENFAKETSDCKECEKKVSENNVEIGITKGLHKLLNEKLQMFIDDNKSDMSEIRKQFNEKNYQINQINSHLDGITGNIAGIESKMEKEKKEIQEKINEQIKNNHDDTIRLTNERFDNGAF